MYVSRMISRSIQAGCLAFVGMFLVRCDAVFAKCVGYGALTMGAAPLLGAVDNHAL